MSLKYRIALTIFLLEILLVTAVLWQTLGSVTKNIKAQFEQSERVAIQFLANAGKVALITNEYQDFQLHLDTVLKDSHIDSVFVLNSDGRVVATNRRHLIGLPAPVPSRDPSLFPRQSDIKQGSQNIGSVIVWFSHAGLIAAIEAAQSRGLWTALAGMAGIAVIGVVMGFALSRRLEKLALTVDRYAADDPNIEIDITGNDETARLARSFRAMIDQIQENVSALTNLLENSRQAQAALEDSEARYRELIEGSRLGIQVASFAGERLLVNKALAEMLGYDSGAELMHMERRALIAPHDRDHAITAELTWVAGDNLPQSYEIDLVRKDGSILPVEIFWRVVDWGGEPALQRTFIDITERKKAQDALVEREEHLRLMLNAISDGLFGIDVGGICTFCNPAGLRLLGFDQPADVIGRDMHGLIHGGQEHDGRETGSDCKVKQAFRQDREVACDDETFQRSDGTRFSAAFRSLPVRREGEVVGTVVTFCDLTQKRENEALLEKNNQVIRELQWELSRASRVSAMDEVATVIAHELHQPLTAIVSSANAAQRLLANSGEVGDKVVFEEVLPLISGQAHRAGLVIREIRALFEGGAQERSGENPRTLVDEACALINLDHASHPIRFMTEFDAAVDQVLANKIQIQQVLCNLIRNSIDAVREEASLSAEIRIAVRRIDDDMAEISISDNGPGIKPEHIAEIFEPFFTSKEKGMGMGLYTCKAIIDAHQGQIWAESNAARGATFHFTLPVDKQAGAKFSPQHAKARKAG